MDEPGGEACGQRIDSNEREGHFGGKRAHQRLAFCSVNHAQMHFAPAHPEQLHLHSHESRQRGKQHEQADGIYHPACVLYGAVLFVQKFLHGLHFGFHLQWFQPLVCLGLQLFGCAARAQDNLVMVEIVVVAFHLVMCHASV